MSMTPPKEINEFWVIREINKISRLHYYDRRTIFDHHSYLKECLNCLRTFFSVNVELSDKYLFSALTLRKEHTETIEVIKVNDDTGYDFAEPVKASFEPIIAELLKAINDNQCISLTRTLLKNSVDGRVLFFTSKRDYDAPIKPYPGQESDAKVRFFPLSSIKYAGNDFDSFLTDHEPQIFEFKRSIVDDSKSEEGLTEYSLERLGTLLWYYKKLEIALDETALHKDFSVHFFRPSFIEFEHNILLSLGTSQLLKPHQIAFLGLLIYRIASQMAIERIKEVEMIESLSHVSVSTHAIKTAINGLLSPPLNSLWQTDKFRNEYSLKVALKSRDKLLALTEVINLMSKLTSQRLNDQELRSALISSNLFSPYKMKYALTAKLRELFILQKTNLQETAIRIREDVEVILDSDFLAYGELFPTELFYELLLLTVVENCIKHGYVDKNEDFITLTITYTERTVSFSNRPKRADTFSLDLKNATGNLRLFYALVLRLQLGEIFVYSADDFYFILRSN